MIQDVLLSILINADTTRVWNQLIDERKYYESVVYDESPDKTEYNIKETFKTPLGKVHCDFRCKNIQYEGGDLKDHKVIMFNLVKGSHLKSLSGWWYLKPVNKTTELTLNIEEMQISYPVPDMLVKPVMVKIINSRLKSIKKVSEAVVK